MQKVQQYTVFFFSFSFFFFTYNKTSYFICSFRKLCFCLWTRRESMYSLYSTCCTSTLSHWGKERKKQRCRNMY